MKITKTWLEENQACQSGIKWFLNQDDTDFCTIVIKLVKEDKNSDAWWCLRKKLTKEHSQQVAIHAAKLVLPIFEKSYPKDKSVRVCINATKKYLKNPTVGNQKNLREKRRLVYAADTAYADADADADTYTAADAAAYAAAYAADGATYTTDAATYDADAIAAANAVAAYAATYATDAAYAATYDADARKKIQLKLARYACKLIKKCQ